MKKTNDTTKKTTKSATEHQLTLLKSIETIVDEARNSQLSEKFMTRCHDEIQFVADAYGITPQQAILFCITLECGPNHVQYYELPRFLDMSNVKSLSFGPDIKAMIDMRLLRYYDSDHDAFGVPEPVVTALRENKAVIRPTLLVDDCITLFEVMNPWFGWLENGSISPADLCEDLTKLFKDNSKKIAFARQMLELKLTNNDLLILTFFCHRFINEDDNQIVPGQLSDLFARRATYKRTVKELSGGSHRLMQKGWIENACIDGTADSSMFCLTDKARRELLCELDIEMPTVKLSNLMEPKTIKAKSMFYPNAMQQQIDELNNFLDDKQFVQIQQRMADNGFRTGFACLFYGAPGTGKTETVYQLARTTGRSIMLVDVPQIKSKWVGDSEKNIKALFDRYRDLVKRSKLTPILLFNEADAIFGVRKNGAENAVDKMENTIQNIILQEMETLHGIMIATTNLAGNLDDAFERRFLYKVKFEKPDATVRCRIWQEMIPGLSNADAATLAKAYELSGGQIENVARKNAINIILHGDSDSRLATLMDYCKTEALAPSATRPRMGF
jgi:hypothetical protein